ncbi:MAG: sigma-70 family RNA polymerase sigma factor [Selenomonadaceae bacterium]|nr:sigma-70 family RNA polymerase sigma factor [Selenomonadaceae bacterium]
MTLHTISKKNTVYWNNLAVKAIVDESAFTELYEHFFPRIYQHLVARTKDETLADEIAGDAFTRMYQHLNSYDPNKGAFSTWLFRIAQNALYKRGQDKHAVHGAEWEEDFDPAAPEAEIPERQFLNKERNKEILEAVAKLPKRQQEIIKMTYWMDMKGNEIAQKLSIAPSSVRVTLKQAREKLRELLG